MKNGFLTENPDSSPHLSLQHTTAINREFLCGVSLVRERQRQRLERCSDVIWYSILACLVKQSKISRHLRRNPTYLLNSFERLI